MKKILLTILTLFCLITSTYASNKQDLIKQANTGNIQAMLDLHKKYNFPETKEGLAYYKKWYKTIDKKDEAADIFAFSQVFSEYRKMFVNGESKYIHLLELAKDKNYKKAFLPLFEFYARNYMDIKEYQLKELILKNPSKEDLEKIYKIYLGSSYLGNKAVLHYKAREIQKLMVEKGFVDKSIYAYNQLLKGALSKKQKNKVLKQIYDSNDFENTLKTADFLYDYKDKETAKFYTKALKLAKKDSDKSDIYINLALIYERANAFKLKKDVKKSISYLKEAIALKNSEAYIRLLSIYSKDKKYKNEAAKLEKEILKTTKSKKTYATYLSRIYKKKEASKLLEELAKAKDENTILKLAFSEKSYSYPIDVNKISEQTKKWQNYILKSHNESLRQRAKEEILKNKTLVVLPKLREDLLKKDLKETNLLTLRKLAKIYERNDDKLSLKYMTLAYDSGDIKSGFNLANTFLNKKETTQKGIKVLEELEKKGEIKAIRKLAELYYSPGYKQKQYKDINKGLEYYKKASSLKDLYSTKDLYEIYFESKDFKNAKIYIQKAQDMGKIDYSYLLGRFFLFGIGEKKDLQKAKSYFEEAAKYYIPKAFYELGLLYYEKNKDKIKTDNKKALEYFKMGAKFENYESIYTLGTIYTKGYAGVNANNEKAISYYEKIAYLNPDIAYYVAYSYIDKKDYKNAFKYFEKSINRKTGKGCFELAQLYEKGLGVEKSTWDALRFYDKAYEKTGNPQAAFNIAHILHYDKKDLKRAKQWYEKANTPEAKKELQKILKSEKLEAI
jgi:uncharacterized protein